MPDTSLLGLLFYAANLFVTDPGAFCTSLTVYGEARGESIAGQAQVAQVIYNRVGSKHYPNSECEVVSQPKQFVGYGAALPRSLAQIIRWRKIVDVVVEQRSGVHTVPQCSRATHFDNVRKKPYWVAHLKRVCQVDRHVFYR